MIVSCHVCHPSLANDNLAGHRGGHVPGPRAGRADAVLHLPVHLRARHHRGDHLAGPQRGAGGTGQARPRTGLRGRLGPTDVQTEQARRRGDRPGDAARAGRVRTPAPRQRVHSVRLRRAAVLLARVRSRRGLAQPYPVRRLPRVSHLGGQPGLRLPGRDGGHPRRLPRGVRRPRPQPAVRQPQSLRRTTAGPTGVVRRARRPQRHQAGRDGHALGAQPLRRCSTVCWTSPSGPGCRSSPSPPRPTPCTAPD